MFTKQAEVSGNKPYKRTLHAKPSTVNPLKGHEAFLKTLETAGAVVSIEELDTGAVLVGTLKHSDKFTISLKVPTGDGDRYQVFVIFKHAIKKFWTAPDNQPSAE